ncbi:MAG TPA: hypothetical protein VJH96_03840 [Patescibacteria group bacterium]|nr:hypothetical protein [Patescibacteria group bacterium]
MERAPEKINTRPVRPFIKPWQKESLTLYAISQVLEFFNVDNDTFPRLARAAFVALPLYDARGGEINFAHQELIKNPAVPVVLFDIAGMRERTLKYAVGRNPSLVSISQFPNVRVIDALRFVQDVFTAYDTPRKSLFSQETTNDAFQRTQSFIRHDLRHALSGHQGFDQQKFIERARRELQLTGSDEEVIAVVMEGVPFRAKSHMDVAGLFVDWAGTLYKNESVDTGLLQEAKTQAKNEKLPLVVWTGGNVDDVYRMLARSSVTDVDVCSKQDCFGLKVAKAIDDESVEKLQEYGIAVDSLKQISY